MHPIEWLEDGRVRYLDQTRLPRDEAWLETLDYRELARAIREMKVRGAPLIGITAAYALAGPVKAPRQAQTGPRPGTSVRTEAAPSG